MSEHLQSIDADDFKFKVLAAICALTHAVYSIHHNGIVGDDDIDELADALDALSDSVGIAPYPTADVIDFPGIHKPEGGST